MFCADTRTLFEIQFPDLITPFRFHLLSLPSQRKARDLFIRNPGMIPQLEDDILRTCLVSPIWFLDQMEYSKAFTVTTIVNLIMMYSGDPGDPEVANYHLNLERGQIQSDVTKQMQVSISRAFPGMNPETVETMSWGSLIKWYALAEHLLLQINGIAEPLRFLGPEERQPKGSRRGLQTKQGETMITRDMPINFEAEAFKLSKDIGFSAHDEPEIQREKMNMLEYAKKLLAEKEAGVK